MPLDTKLAERELKNLEKRILFIMRSRILELCMWGFHLLFFQVNADTLGHFGGELGFRDRDFIDMLEFTGLSKVTVKNWADKLDCAVELSDDYDKVLGRREKWFRFSPVDTSSSAERGTRSSSKTSSSSHVKTVHDYGHAGLNTFHRDIGLPLEAIRPKSENHAGLYLTFLCQIPKKSKFSKYDVEVRSILQKLRAN
jgi:hypothetical protein